MEKVAIYCRLSVEDSGRGESESIANQRSLLTEYAQNQGWSIYSVFEDDDYSGLREDRPAFCQMIAQGAEGLFSIVLCKTQSRFTRSATTAEKYLHEKFPLWGIRFVSVIDGVDTAKRENKKARQINGLVNEWYSEELSDNIRAVLRRKMEQGQFLGNYAPYGYEKDTENHHHLVVQGEEALWVQTMAEWYLSGLSCKKIAARLTAEDVLTPSQGKQRRGQDLGRAVCKTWGAGTVGKILANPVYLGHMVQGKEGKISFKEKKTVLRPRDQWIVVEDTHEAILSAELFEKVEARRKGNRRG